MDEIKWRIVEVPQRVRDDQVPYSTYYITDDDVVVAQIIGEHEVAYQIVKRLNLWEEREHEEMVRYAESLQQEKGR